MAPMDYKRHFGYKHSDFGSDTYGHDVKAFGDTTGKYFLWDASADTAYVVGTLSVTGTLTLDGTFNADNIALIDAETLTFGTGSDVVMQWDGTNLIVAAAADDSLIEIGDSATSQKSFDLKWYANENSGASYLYADASANLIYTTGVDLQFKDSDFLVFGTGAGATGDINFTWDATNFVMATPAASAAWLIGATSHVINTTLTGTLTVGVNDTGHDVKFFGATNGKYMLWDESADSLLVAGTIDGTILSIGGTAITATAAEINRAADISARIVNVTTTPLAVAETTHESKLVTVNKADGVAITLPEATGGGAKYTFLIGTTITSSATTIKVTGDDIMTGVAIICNDSDASVSGFETGATDDTITFNGTTTGGIKGDLVELIDVAANTWYVRVNGSATGSEATPFSATVT